MMEGLVIDERKDDVWMYGWMDGYTFQEQFQHIAASAVRSHFILFIFSSPSFLFSLSQSQGSLYTADTQVVVVMFGSLSLTLNILIGSHH